MKALGSQSQSNSEVKKLRIVGRSVRRLDAVEKVTGSVRYSGDYVKPGTLTLKVLRSRHSSAQITALDSTPALAVPGVRGVITGVDFRKLIGDVVRDQPILAQDRVRYVGEPIAGVIAETPEAAQQGIESVRVTYQSLSSSLGVEQSLAAGGFLIHPNLADYTIVSCIHAQAGTNICHHYQLRTGTPLEALASAAITHEGTYEFPHIAHAALEPHSATACWERDGSLWLITSSQSPHLVRTMLAETFEIPESMVTVIAPPLGGGFGGKSDFTIEPLVVLAARTVIGSPVRLTLEREEVFSGTVLGRGCKASIHSAWDKDGKFIAAQIRLLFAVGAYANNAVNIVDGGGHNALGPYFVPNVQVDSLGLYTNTPPIGAFRGYGHPEVHWMLERHIDEVVDRQGWDPGHIRLLNLIKPGMKNAFGQTIEVYHGNAEAVVTTTAERLATLKSKYQVEAHERLGAGLAAFVKSPVMATNAASSAVLKVHRDGSVDLAISASEMGQGSTTVLSQIAAESLELPLHKIRINHEIDTRTCPYEWQTVGSTTTWKVGNAILAATAQLKNQARANAAAYFGVPLAEVEYRQGEMVTKEPGRAALSLGKVALGCVRADGSVVGSPLIATGWYLPKGLTYADANTGQGRLAASWTFGCQAAVLKVNVMTGRVTVLDMLTVMDVGGVINPQLAEQQVIGAMVQGLGATFLEKIVYAADGSIRNASFTDYKIPGLEDVPNNMEVIFLTTPSVDAPYNAKPLAEHGIVGVAPALVNAIRDATGLHFSSLPVTSELILERLHRGEASR